MAYIIPNATETGSGKKYANINQAEPDSVDIEALGNRSNWVRSGCAVTIDNEYVTVASGNVVVAGVPYACSGLPSQQIERATVGARTDLIVARLNGAVIEVKVLEGIDTATNPIFPKSKSVLTNPNDFLQLSNYDPDNDVLIATIYVTASETDINNIVDKRIINASPVVRKYDSTFIPASMVNTYDVVGDIVVDSQSRAYFRTASSWELIPNSESAGPPVGSLFAWAGPYGTSPGANYLECDGTQKTINDYPILASILGSTYGAITATQFYLPKLDDDRIILSAKATSTSDNTGATGGNNSVTLSYDYLPLHDHAVSVNAHGNNGTITHGTGTGSMGATPQTGGHHAHTTVGHLHDGALIYRHPSEHNNHHVTNVTHGDYSTSSFHVDAINVNEGDPYNPWVNDSGDTVETGDGYTRFKQNSHPNTNSGGGHTHSVTVPDHTGLSHTVNQSSVGATGPTALSLLPKYVKMRWFIRAK